MLRCTNAVKTIKNFTSEVKSWMLKNVFYKYLIYTLKKIL